MVFPQTPLDSRIEILVNGTWTNITSDVYSRDGIQIKRGSSNESAQVEPSTASLTLNNRDGVYSPRNPTGTYYGQIGRNTRARISVPNASGTYLDLPGAVTDRATAPDAAALGITGDIDIRIDMSLDSWRDAQQFAGKYVQTGDQRSWVLQMNANGTLNLAWTTAGTFASLLAATSTLPVPVPGTGRRAIRATLDVNNGAAGKTATFYYSDTISGSWTQLGDPVTTAGTTSIFDSTAAVEVGNVSGLSTLSISPFGATTATVGRVHAFQLRDGIGGTVVANPDFTIQDAGDTSFADTASSPNTWTIAGAAALDDRDYRVHGVIPAWPVRWDTSGTDVYVPTEISGILRRIGRETTPLRSTMYRALVTLVDSPPIAYWPCEDESGATTLASGLPSGSPMSILGTAELASSSVFPGSDSLPKITNSIWSADVPAYAASSDGQVRFLLSIPAAGMTNNAVIFRFFTTGSARRWDFVYTTASGGGLQLKVYNNEGTELGSSSTDTPYNGENVRISIGFQNNGADVDFEWRRMELGTTVEFTAIGSVVGANAGNITSVVVDPTASVGETVLGHISVHPELTALDDLSDELNAYTGETAGRRIERLCSEEDITFRRRGDLDDSVAMGAQRPNSLITLFREAADTDDGVLYEPRHVFGLGYRPRSAQYNQEYVATFDYVSNELFGSLAPTDDDLYTGNDVTAARVGGSSARRTLESGALSVLDPPDGVGVYDKQVTVNVQYDYMLPDQAGWRVHLGTVDEPRYPEITVNLANPRIAADATLASQTRACDIADRLAVQNLPSWLPPGDLDQLMLGSTELLGNFEHQITFNCAPAAPYTVGIADDTDLGRADTEGAELAEALTTTETDMDVTTTAYPLWTTDAAQYPFDLTVGGEVVTATACTSSVLDTFTRSVTDGWGSPNVGAAWTNSGGSATDYDVNGTVGTHTMTSVSLSRWSRIPQVIADFDLIVDVASNDLASGNSQYVGLTARAVDINNLYVARAEFTTAGAVILSIRKRVAGVETELDTYTSTLTHVVDTYYRIRFQGVGSLLRARVWAATGLEQENVWQAEVTDTDLAAAGSLGVRSILNALNTDVNPVMKYDNFASLNPQTITVTRSVNGVVKAQSAGADVRLHRPAIAAL
ncbi:hypothetical protein ACH492_22110 [Streptomyces sp. NPDC019443]|uniref:hypothetical protein n=1 Tax=Streptomyces sp. NPDC019443 TaxID=3365061 RepID=UPI00378AE95C